MFKLGSCDVLICVNEGKNWLSSFSKWAIGRYEHVAMYLGRAFDGVPFLVESTGRGVAIHSLQPQTGRLVVVARLKIDAGVRMLITEEAINLANDSQSYYDYFSIVHSCVPRVLKEKFPFLPIPLKYHRDPMMICSELVAELFWRAGIEVLPQDIIPLPGDFAESPLLEILYEGRLMEDILP